MSALEVVIPCQPCSPKWGPEQKPKALTDSVTNEEYEKMRDIMQAYRNKGLAAGAGISVILAIICLATAPDLVWSAGIPWALCLPIAMSKGRAKVNVELLSPKGMSMQSHRCFAHRIVREAPDPAAPGDAPREGGAGALEAQPVTAQVEFEAASAPQRAAAPEPRVYTLQGASVPEGDAAPEPRVYAKKERRRAPANYGTVELTHSSLNDVGEDVVRSMYSHLSNGAKRSERVIACNLKVVYVPEEDLMDLVQIYASKQMADLRATSKNEDGARRVLRFFLNDGMAVCSSYAGFPGVSSL